MDSNVNKRKCKLFGLVMSAILLVSSLAVWAGSNSIVFGSGSSDGTGVITASNSLVIARTIPTYPSSVTSMSTRARSVNGSGGTSSWVKEYDYVATGVIANCSYGESYHSINGIPEEYVSCPYG